MFVHESVAEVFNQKLIKLFQSRKIGNPEDKSVFQGPQGDKNQRDRIVSILEKGSKDGKVVCGGKAISAHGKVRASWVNFGVWIFFSYANTTPGLLH